MGSWLKSFTNEEMQDKLNKEQAENRPEYLQSSTKQAEARAKRAEIEKKKKNIKLTKFEIMELLENNNIEFEYNKNIITIAT